MVKRRGDKSPGGLGDRAAERLRLFEQARGIASNPSKQKTDTGVSGPNKNRGDADEGKARPKNRSPWRA